MRHCLFALPTLAALTAALTISSAVRAQAPDSLGFQGYITDSGSEPLDSSGVSITFKLYKDGTAVWTETQLVDVSDGVFNVLLGKNTPMDTVAFNQPIDLGIKLDGEGAEISPPTPLNSVAYARALPGFYTFYRENATSQSFNVVGGAYNNVVGPDVVGATIGGGGGMPDELQGPNMILGSFGTIGGGANNTASSWSATVGGGRGNTASGNFATVGGGYSNTASNGHATVSGGVNNKASDWYAAVGGGFYNTASAFNATVGGGYSNTASGTSATVPGGYDNSAAGDYSLAAGHDAKANHEGTFVWNDRSITSGNDSLVSTGDNQFLIRAAGGVGIGTNAPASQLHVDNGAVTITNQGNGAVLLNLETERNWEFRQLGTGLNTALELASVGGGANKSFIINTTGAVGIGTTTPVHPLEMGSGAHVTGGGTWTDGSSRTFKEDLRPVDSQGVLSSVVGLPIYRWRYKGSDEGDHLGPVAEDFYDSFRLGNDERYIAGVDGDGVALAAIQGLYELVKEQAARIDELERRLAKK